MGLYTYNWGAPPCEKMVLKQNRLDGLSNKSNDIYINIHKNNITCSKKEK
jgi:hypothetical protein